MTDSIEPIGHADAFREVSAAYASGRMPHAWIIAGIEGIGKAVFAKEVASFVLGNRGLVEAESHPDLLIIRRSVDERTGETRNVIPVDDVLGVAQFLHKSASHGGWRVVIIDEAHTLNRFGQNAILKIIEEPPPKALILITVTTPGVMLPTIRSRARLLELAPLGADNLKSILKIKAPQASAADIDAVAELAGGSVGFALKILRADALGLYRTMLQILDALPQMDIARVHQLADQVAKKADAEAFDVLKTLLLERLRKTAEHEAKKHPDGNVGLALKIWEKTRETFAAADYGNLDRKLTFVTALMDIKAAM